MRERLFQFTPRHLSQISHYAAIPAAAGVGGASVVLSARPHVDQGGFVAISVVEHPGVLKGGSI